MSKNELMIIADYTQDASLTLEELCEICHVNPNTITDLIAYEIIPSKVVFNLAELKRIQAALRLQRDLEVNLAGAALALDLLDELKSLREQSELLQRLFLKR